MTFAKTKEENRSAIVALLAENKLPSEDLPGSLEDFYSVFEGDKLVGFIGLERYGHYGLLRSMVVHPEFRNRQIADTMVKMLESHALSTGVSTIYLLTETADKYFSKRGYTTISRDEVPGELQQSSEFSHVCPKSAIVMKKGLEGLESLEGLEGLKEHSTSSTSKHSLFV